MGCMSEGTADATGGGRNRFVYVVAAVSALSGLLFGYHTCNISSALLFIKDDFGFTDNGQQIVVASLLLGAVFGALLGGRPLRPGAGWGRRRDGRAGLHRWVVSQPRARITSLAAAVPDHPDHGRHPPSAGRQLQPDDIGSFFCHGPLHELG